MKFKKPHLPALFFLFTIGLSLWLVFKTPHPASPQSDPLLTEQIATVLPLPEAWTGDLNGMQERRLIRILVPYSKTLYFIDRGQERGIVHDSGMELQKWLNRKGANRTQPVRVMFIPTARERLLQDLVDGLGDIAAGNLTVTPSRQEIVDFTDAGLLNVNEIVVTGPDVTDVNQLSDLTGISIYVRKSSSYYEHIRKLREQGLKLKIKPADEALEDEDLLEMVNAGLLPLAIVDDHKAKFWTQVFNNIKLREDLVINQGGRIAWAVRKESPLLMTELNNFGRKEGRQKGLTNILLQRYLGSTSYIVNATNQEEMAKFHAMRNLFIKYAEQFNLDPLLMTAQAYQESRLNQSARSRAGAVGIMQLLPSTAASDPVNISNIEKDIEQNIHAGAKYLRHLIDTYLDSAEIDDQNRLLLSLAAYNAGPGNLQRIRRKTVEMGLDKNIWFNNVEHAAAHIIGRETVQYVSNIYKYYLAYRLVEEQRKIRTDRLESSST